MGEVAQPVLPAPGVRTAPPGPGLRRRSPPALPGPGRSQPAQRGGPRAAPALGSGRAWRDPQPRGGEDAPSHPPRQPRPRGPQTTPGGDTGAETSVFPASAAPRRDPLSRYQDRAQTRPGAHRLRPHRAGAAAPCWVRSRHRPPAGRARERGAPTQPSPPSCHRPVTPRSPRSAPAGAPPSAAPPVVPDAALGPRDRGTGRAGGSGSGAGRARYGPPRRGGAAAGLPALRDRTAAGRGGIGGKLTLR